MEERDPDEVEVDALAAQASIVRSRLVHAFDALERKRGKGRPQVVRVEAAHCRPRQEHRPGVLQRHSPELHQEFLRVPHRQFHREGLHPLVLRCPLVS